MNWQEFFEANHIEYVTRGPNTKRGEISVRCPFCGEDDPSQHMGIKLEGEAWGCLRDATHRGKWPIRLIQALLGGSRHQAELAFQQYSKSDPDNFIAPPIMSPSAELEPEPVWRAIKPRGSTAKFWDYLQGRGFMNTQDVIDKYDLRCCLTDKWKDRLYFRFWFGGKLVAWQGRAITKTIAAPRYLSSKTLKHTIFNEDKVMRGGDALFITEGPFDAMKLDHYSRNGIRATCTFGVTPAIEQINVLRLAKKRYKLVVVLFDTDAFGQALQFCEWLAFSNVKIGLLPPGIKDPGEMSPTMVDTFTQNQLVLLTTHDGGPKWEAK